MVYDDEEYEDWFAVCSCETGMKGAVCIHAIALYFKEGKMNNENDSPQPAAKEVKGFSRNQSKVPHHREKTNKQVRF